MGANKNIHWIEIGQRGNEFFAYLRMGFSEHEVAEIFKSKPEVVLRYAARHSRWLKNELAKNRQTQWS